MNIHKWVAEQAQKEAEEREKILADTKVQIAKVEEMIGILESQDLLTAMINAKQTSFGDVRLTIVWQEHADKLETEVRRRLKVATDNAWRIPK